MSGINTQGGKARFLQLGINSIAGDYYKDYAMEKDKIFTTYKSDRAYELDVSVSNGGLASFKPEGSDIGYDDSKQDFTKNYTPKVYAIGGMLTMEAQMNNKYEDLITTTGKWIKRSLVHTDEQLAADVINVGYTNNDSMDGVPLFSDAHLLGKGGTFSNRFAVFTSLSQSALEDANIALEDFRDGAGLLIDCKGKSLHIPRQLRYIAKRINGSTLEPDSAQNAINTMSGEFSNSTHVNHRFSSTTDWFIKTDVEQGFKIFERMGYTYSQDNDFGTENFRTKGMLYKSYGFTDPRCAYGSGT